MRHATARERARQLEKWKWVIGVRRLQNEGRKMPDSFQLEMVVAAEPQRVFSTWMDSREHAAFTGGGEAVVEPWNGGRFISWDGYIHGILLGVDEGRRIVQTWRTAEFAPEWRDSRVVVEFEPARGGTRVVVRHSDVPPAFVKRFEKGWTEHYLKPLARYFAKAGKKTPTPRAPESAWGRKPEPPVRRPQKAAAAKTARKPAVRKAARKAPRKAKPKVARRPPAARRRAGARRSRR
jgi:uncharacterized protein YndB with AHSA1/START domain